MDYKDQSTSGSKSNDVEMVGVQLRPFKRRRLRAGLVKIIDDDELSMGDFDDPKKKDTKKDNEKGKDKDKVTVEEKSKANTKTTVKLVFRYIKIIFLLSLLTVCFIFLMLNEEEEYDYRLLAIAPNTSRYYKLPIQPKASGKMTIYVVGPFQERDDLNLDEDNVDPALTINVERVYWDANGQVVSQITVSQDVHIKTVDFNKLEQTYATRKERHVDVMDYEDMNEDKCELRLLLKTNFPTYLTVNLMIDDTPVDKSVGIIYGFFVLLFLYVMIIWELINQTFASMIAALLAITILAAMGSRPPLTRIIDWIEVETLLLLFGMMILMAILSETGIFDYLAVYAFEKTKGKKWPLLYILCIFTAILSSVLDNVTIMLLMVPVTIRLAEVTKLQPVPIMISMILSSNIGAALTAVGDPPNIIISANPTIIAHGVNFGNFFLHMVIPCTLAMIVCLMFLRYYYRKPKTMELQESEEVEELRKEIQVWERTAAGINHISKEEEMVYETVKKKIAKLRKDLEVALQKNSVAELSYEDNLALLKQSYPIRSKPLLIKSCIAFCFVLSVFLLHSLPHFLHLNLGWAALLGALLLIILADISDMSPILARVEWSTLLFFASLLICMEALSELGLIDLIGNAVVNVILMVEKKWQLAVAMVIVLWVSGISSSILNNIPLTTMMLKIIISLSHNEKLKLPLQPLVWSLACGACYGGNGTILGASANVVCAGIAEQHGYKMGFVKYAMVGYPVMFLSLITSTVYLLIAHVAFEWHYM